MMVGVPTLYGYQFSVYAWIARLALQEKDVAFEWVEIDPFSDTMPDAYLALNPFRRVPTLKVDAFAVYETGAITRFVDESFGGPDLQPASASERARMTQFISILDHDAYWPMVRQVFSHGFFLEREGEAPDPSELSKGLAASAQVLVALDNLMNDTLYAVGETLSLADIHLAPMVSYFSEVPEAAEMIASHTALSRWWQMMRERAPFIDTRPDLSKVGSV